MEATINFGWVNRKLKMSSGGAVLGSICSSLSKSKMLPSSSYSMQDSLFGVNLLFMVLMRDWTLAPQLS